MRGCLCEWAGGRGVGWLGAGEVWAAAYGNMYVRYDKCVCWVLNETDPNVRALPAVAGLRSPWSHMLLQVPGELYQVYIFFVVFACVF